MSNETEATTLSFCDGCRLIPVSVFELDHEKPLGGWSAFFETNDIEVRVDDVGRPAIAREDAGRLIAQRRKRERGRAEEGARRAAVTRQAPAGIPGRPGASAIEVMMGHDQK